MHCPHPMIVLASVVMLGCNAQPEFTPNTIRIQSLESPEKGEWVVMPGFKELGSPCL
jgi:hypothetical protein